MSVLTGRYGKVSYDPVPASPVAPVEIVALNAWQLSYKTDYQEVTAFNASNKVYVPGLPDCSGSVSGFWDSAELALITAAQATTPGYLQLEPNRNDGSHSFGGLAYLDASIDCSLAAPKITGSFRAAGNWTLPS